MTIGSIGEDATIAHPEQAVYRAMGTEGKVPDAVAAKPRVDRTIRPYPHHGAALRSLSGDHELASNAGKATR